MKKGFRIGSVLLSLLLCVSLIVPALAAEVSTPEITWLSIESAPTGYIEEMNWLALAGEIYSTFYYYPGIDLATGERVEYDAVAPFYDGLAAVGKFDSEGNLKFGYIDTTGTLVVPLEYDRVHNFFNGLGRVYKSGSGYGCINTAGEVVIPFEYGIATNYTSDGMMALISYVSIEEDSYDEIVNFVDSTGEVKLTFSRREWDIGYGFRDGLLKVQQIELAYDDDGNLVEEYSKCGYMDKTGAIAIPLEYDFAGDFENGLACVGKYDASGNMKYFFIDNTGAVVMPSRPELDIYGGFYDGLSTLGKYDADRHLKYGYMDTTGAVVVPLEYDGAAAFSEGLARVMKYGADGSEKYGYIDKTGAVVIPLEYDSASSFNGGLSAVGIKYTDGNTKFGFVDKTGAVVIPLEYDGAGYIGGGENDTVRLCWVQKGDNYGIFENPYYVAPEETPGTEQGNTEESPAPGSDSPGGQETANPGNTENTADSGGGFPVVPVVIAVVVVVVAAVVAALALKKKNPAPTAPHGKPTQEVKPEQAQSFKFCPKCGTKVPMDTNFCPKCGKQLESGEG